MENKRDRVRRDGEEARARRRRDREDEKLDVVVVVLPPPWVSNFYRTERSCSVTNEVENEKRKERRTTWTMMEAKHAALSALPSKSRSC